MTPSSSDHELHTGVVTASKLNIALLCLAIASIGAALYLSPASTPLRTEVNRQISGSPTPAPEAAGAPTPTPSSGATATTAAPATATTAAPGVTSLLQNALYRGSAGTSAAARLNPPSVLAPRPASTTHSAGTTSAATPPPTTKPAVVKTTCWQFDWQQDAQQVYLANLSDPFGLDGDPGPNDSDGLACSSLPVDARRPASTPAGAYVPPIPSAATKAALVSPAKDYFGFSQDGLPGDGAAFDSIATAAGKAPSSVGWFSTFDDAYRGDLVTRSWSRAALPVVTWLPTDSGSGTSYSLTTIANGSHDAYLRRFAGEITRTNLPVVIRFGHEMNGSWYGWSSGRSDYNNSPEKYVAAWRHIWNVFDEVGANQNVVWLWSPSRVDNLTPSPTNGLTPMAASYPGDAYVDWVGASVYLRYPKTGPTFEASFAKTIAALGAVTDKPMFFAEVGAVESSGGVDEAALKAQWIHNLLSNVAGDPRIVGFLWFNNVSSAVVDGQAVANDWRFTSSPEAAAQFKKDIAVPQFASGNTPD